MQSHYDILSTILFYSLLLALGAAMLVLSIPKISPQNTKGSKEMPESSNPRFKINDKVTCNAFKHPGIVYAIYVSQVDDNINYQVKFPGLSNDGLNLISIKVTLDEKYFKPFEENITMSKDEFKMLMQVATTGAKEHGILPAGGNIQTPCIGLESVVEMVATRNPEMVDFIWETFNDK